MVPFGGRGNPDYGVFTLTAFNQISCFLPQFNNKPAKSWEIWYAPSMRDREKEELSHIGGVIMSRRRKQSGEEMAKCNVRLTVDSEHPQVPGMVRRGALRKCDRLH